MKVLKFLNAKHIKLLFFCIFVFTCQSSWSKVCLSFDLRPYKSSIQSPFEVKEFLFSRSSQISEPDAKLLFLDYSDNGDVLAKHAFTSCTEIMNKYYKCVAEEYNFSIDMSQKEPILYFSSLMVSDYDSPLEEIKSNTNKHVKIIGRKKTCPTPDREKRVIEG
jgi:hypothetical protein